MLDLRSNPKKDMVYGTITSPYVHSRVDSQHIYHGQPYVRVDLNPIPYASVNFIPQSGTLDLASGFSLCLWIRIQM
jgi:hypothetical protein